MARSALSEGPQKIFRREGNIVVISEEEYIKLTSHDMDFKNFLLSTTPDLGEIDLSRDQSSMRDINL